ncbi:MAG: cytochrome C oxidase subunit IV family protein [Actinomycetota bacterium]
MTDSVASEAPREDVELAHHPTPRAYVKVAVILAIVTAFEVAIYYIESVRTFLVPLLIFFALIKFVMVAAYFMHLRFDSPIFKRFFVVGLALAFTVFGIVLWFFFTHGGAAPALST